MKKVTFDNIKYINYNIRPTNSNIWYNDIELFQMSEDFLYEIKVISKLYSCTLKDGLTIWKNNIVLNE